MVGFRLKNTLSESGAVSRGICQADDAGKLVSVTERTGILPDQVGEGRALAPNTLVSMNCWGFTPAVFPMLDEEFVNFLTHGMSHAPTKAEFYLPAAVSSLIGRGRLVADVLPCESSWFGVTYKEDKPAVVASIKTLISAGLYPERLWA